MRRLPPPLRFLVGLCAGWTCARAATLWLAPWGGEPVLNFKLASAPRPPAVAGPAAADVGVNPLQAPSAAAAASVRLAIARFRAAAAPAARRVRTEASAPARAPPAAAPIAAHAIAKLEAATEPLPGTGASLPGPPPAFGAQAPAFAQRRWKLSAWAFVRRGGAAALAPGGMLGGSQVGARATYRVAGRAVPVALSLRLSSPLGGTPGAEAAAGLDWKPISALPLHLLVERRQKLGRDGRSAFGATVYAGGEARLGPLRLDGYAQAGIVGIRRRDPFVDGAARAAVALGSARLGAGAWAAAQPGASRLDVGPHAALRLSRPNALLSADWRFRVAGHARPGSGPAITLAADF